MSRSTDPEVEGKINIRKGAETAEVAEFFYFGIPPRRIAVAIGTGINKSQIRIPEYIIPAFFAHSVFRIEMSQK